MLINIHTVSPLLIRQQWWGPNKAEEGVLRTLSGCIITIQAPDIDEQLWPTAEEKKKDRERENLPGVKAVVITVNPAEERSLLSTLVCLHPLWLLPIQIVHLQHYKNTCVDLFFTYLLTTELFVCVYQISSTNICFPQWEPLDLEKGSWEPAPTKLFKCFKCNLLHLKDHFNQAHNNNYEQTTN